MLEIPESTTVARQLNETACGKRIRRVAANASPHKFAFYHGDPADYDSLLRGQDIGESRGIGAMVEVIAGDRQIVLGDGARLRYYDEVSDAPPKHQLRIEFEDRSALVCSVQMYGAVFAFVDGQFENKYYAVAKAKPQPLSAAFDWAYFAGLRVEGTDQLSVKAYLATEQRIPGLGNGVLQDILFCARLHPKRKMAALANEEYAHLYAAVKDVLAEMTRLGGRDTEQDLFGNEGGYATLLSKNTVGKPCSICGAEIQKAAYMGGTVYWCPNCQPFS